MLPCKVKSTPSPPAERTQQLLRQVEGGREAVQHLVSGTAARLNKLMNRRVIEFSLWRFANGTTVEDVLYRANIPCFADET